MELGKDFQSELQKYLRFFVIKKEEVLRDFE